MVKGGGPVAKARRRCSVKHESRAAAGGRMNANVGVIFGGGDSGKEERVKGRGGMRPR